MNINDKPIGMTTEEELIYELCRAVNSLNIDPTIDWTEGYPTYDLRYAPIGSEIHGPVANFSALPPVNTVLGQYWEVLSAQGVQWIGALYGGTYYPNGLYYADPISVSWIYSDNPRQASQATVNAGIVTDQFVSPATLASATTVLHPSELTSGQIFVGNASNIATGVTPTLNATAGTFSLSNTGVFTFPDASGSQRGWVSTGAQTVAGDKTFTGTTTSFIPTPRTSGFGAYFKIITPADTGLTASTESIGNRFGGDLASGNTVTRQWATGPIAAQRENVFIAPTYAAVGSSTFADVATVAITGAPIATAPVSFTRSYALWVQSGTSRFDGNITSRGVNQVIGTEGNTSLSFQTQNTTRFSFNGSGFATFTATSVTNLSSETSWWNFNFSTTKGIASGTTLATQRELLIQAPTYTGTGGAATITNAATVAITGAPTQGSNMTLTNSYALWVQNGNVLFDGPASVVGVNDLTVLDNNGSTRSMALDSQTNGRLTVGRDFAVVRILNANWLYNTTQFTVVANGTMLHNAGTETDVFKFRSTTSANTGFQWAWQSGRTDASGTLILQTSQQSFAPTSGNANMTSFAFNDVWNQTGATGVLTHIDINPTVTSVSGTLYGLRSRIAVSPTGGGVAWNLYMDGTAPNWFAGSNFFKNTSSATVQADTFQMYSADLTAGNAVPHFLTEAGDVIKLAAASGWGTPTGTLTRTAFDPATVTGSELAERVAALIVDLKTIQQFLKA